MPQVMDPQSRQACFVQVIMESSIDPGRIHRSARLRWKDKITVVPPAACTSLHSRNDFPMLVKFGDDALRQQNGPVDYRLSWAQRIRGRWHVVAEDCAE